MQIETPQDWDTSKPRFYPVGNAATDSLQKNYLEQTLEIPNLFVGGRLGKYKYYDMDDTILAAKDDLMKLLAFFGR